MAVVQRRVFQAKTGCTDELVDVVRQIMGAMQKSGYGSDGMRLMTDRMSGRTDRLAWETEAESIGEIESRMDRMMADQGALKDAGPQIQRINELVEYSEVEYWTVH